MKKRNPAACIISAAIVLATILCSGTMASADREFKNPASVCFDFFPSKVTFENDRVVVEGYFYNFTLDRIIHGIDNLEMAIYDADEKTICYGAFPHLSDSMKSIRLQPGFTSLQVFEFNNNAKNPDDFNLERITAGIACNFTPSGTK